MWIVTNRGLLSIVEDRDDRDRLLVRARQKGLIEAMLAEAPSITAVDTWEDEYADYPYRARMSRAEVTELLHAEVSRIDYPNFKDSVREPRLRALFGEVWATLSRLGMGRKHLQGPRPIRKRPEKWLEDLPSEAFLEDGSLRPGWES